MKASNRTLKHDNFDFIHHTQSIDFLTYIYLRYCHFILYDCQLLIYLKNDPTHRFHKIGLSKFRRISHLYYHYSRNPDFVITIFVSANVEKHKESGIFLLILNAFFHPIQGVLTLKFQYIVSIQASSYDTFTIAHFCHSYVLALLIHQSSFINCNLLTHIEMISRMIEINFEQ